MHWRAKEAFRSAQIRLTSSRDTSLVDSQLVSDVTEDLSHLSLHQRGVNRALSDPILHACSIKRADAEDNITDAEGQSALENENEQGNYCLPLSQTYLTEDTPVSE